MTQKDLRILVRQILNEAEVSPNKNERKFSAIKDVKTTKENKTAYVTGTGGETKAIEYNNDNELKNLKDNPDIKSIEKASGGKVKEGSAVEGELYSYFERIGDIIEELGKALELGGNDPDFAVTMVLDYIRKTYQPNS